jgi:rfaE bifunctional protein kinase chain/domain
VAGGVRRLELRAWRGRSGTRLEWEAARSLALGRAPPGEVAIEDLQPIGTRHGAGVGLVGKVERISREAPVLILRYDTTDVRLGGGANAVHNISTLGGRPVPFGVLGRDEPGRVLRAQLREKGIPTSRVVNERGYATPVKTRILAGRAHSTKQQIVRIDKASSLGRPSPGRRSVLEALRSFEGRVDGVLVSDHGFGLLTPELVKAAVALARRRRVPVTVDSRFDLLRYRGMTAVTPNEPEVEAALGVTIGHDRAKLEGAGRTLLDRLGCQAALVTRGSHGMALFEKGRPTLHIPIHGTDQVADVTGDGRSATAWKSTLISRPAGLAKKSSRPSPRHLGCPPRDGNAHPPRPPGTRTGARRARSRPAGGR